MVVFSRRLLVVGLAIGCLPGAGPPPEKRKDSQPTYEPRSDPGAGQKYLETFAGDWKVIKTFYPKTGNPVKVSGRCRQSMIHDGRFLQSEFVFEQAGKKTTGLGLVGFDPQTGRFTTIWTDSRSTRMSLRQSQKPFNGKEIVLYGRLLEDDGKSPPRSRTVTRLEANGSRLIHHQYVAEPVGVDHLKERLIMDLVMTRSEKSPPTGRSSE